MMDFNEIWAAVIRIAVKQARLIIDDQEALEVKCLYKEWDKQIGNELKVGEFVQFDGKLFRVLQTHVVQTQWQPGQGTESLYVVIDKAHTGTQDDPILYSGNMELFADNFYIENDILYKCIRNSDIPIYHTLSSLLGIYVELVVNELPEEEPTGTVDAPIPYARGMALEKDLYYSQNDVVYLCILNTGGLVYHDLSDLVGLYVMVDNYNIR